MAVPFRKVSKTRRDMRRTHYKIAANGLVNLITPTCGAIMGGLALAKVEYSTWFKWALKVVLTIAVINILVLTIFSLIV